MRPYASLVPIPHITAPVDDAKEWVVRFEGVGVLRAALDGTSSVWRSEPGAEESLARKAQLGCARAFLARLAGHAAFHAGAVGVNDRAVLLLGQSGAGKSTTVAALCARGASMLADDFAVLETRNDGSWLTPSEDAHWLDAASHRALGLTSKGEGWVEGKHAVPVRLHGGPARLTAFVLLSFGEGPVRLEPVTGLAAFELLLPHLMRFVNDAAAVQLWETDRLFELCRLPCHRLVRPLGTEFIGPSAELLLRELLC